MLPVLTEDFLSWEIKMIVRHQSASLSHNAPEMSESLDFLLEKNANTRSLKQDTQRGFVNKVHPSRRLHSPVKLELLKRKQLKVCV